MIDISNETAVRIPMRHLSVRVPRHDAGWDGTVCRFPTANVSCLALNRIRATKNDDFDEQHVGEQLDALPTGKTLPCFAERVNFLSSRAQMRIAHHAYSNTSEHHNHISDTPFSHPPYSAAATPYGWLFKERAWVKEWDKDNIDSNSITQRYGIEALPEYEPDEPAWLKGRPWIQGAKNQKALLNAFFDALKPGHSLIFVYAKRTPLTDDDQWTIVGVGEIEAIGDLQEYDYDPQNHAGLRSYLWERSVCHGIRPDGSNGVLLPYHELFNRCEDDAGIDPSEYVAVVPREYRREFSYASEHVSTGTAISALFVIKSALSKYTERFEGD